MLELIFRVCLTKPRLLSAKSGWQNSRCWPIRSAVTFSLRPRNRPPLSLVYIIWGFSVQKASKTTSFSLLLKSALKNSRAETFSKSEWAISSLQEVKSRKLDCVLKHMCLPCCQRCLGGRWLLFCNNFSPKDNMRWLGPITSFRAEKVSKINANQGDSYLVCFRIGWALIGAVSRTSTARKSHGLGGRAEKCNISMFASPFDDDDRSQPPLR